MITIGKNEKNKIGIDGGDNYEDEFHCQIVFDQKYNSWVIREMADSR